MMYLEDRPYEKCEQYGAEHLTDVELLAVLLRTGTKGENSLRLAQKILHPPFGSEGLLSIPQWSMEQLLKIKGIGKVKSIQILCLAELARRMAKAEAALGLSKALGDLAGPCMFAVTMGISRIIFGKYGEQLDLMKFMSGSGILCVVCYLLAALSSSPIIGLIGCIACGFSVGIMWPGTCLLYTSPSPRDTR